MHILDQVETKDEIDIVVDFLKSYSNRKLEGGEEKRKKEKLAQPLISLPRRYLSTLLQTEHLA